MRGPAKIGPRAGLEQGKTDRPTDRRRPATRPSGPDRPSARPPTAQTRPAAPQAARPRPTPSRTAFDGIDAGRGAAAYGNRGAASRGQMSMPAGRGGGGGQFRRRRSRRRRAYRRWWRPRGWRRSRWTALIGGHDHGTSRCDFSPGLARCPDDGGPCRSPAELPVTRCGVQLR